MTPKSKENVVLLAQTLTIVIFIIGAGVGGSVAVSDTHQTVDSVADQNIKADTAHSPTAWSYTNNDGIIETEGLLDAIDDFRNNKLSTNTLVEVVLPSFRSGNPIAELYFANQTTTGDVVTLSEVALPVGETLGTDHLVVFDEQGTIRGSVQLKQLGNAETLLEMNSASITGLTLNTTESGLYTIGLYANGSDGTPDLDTQRPGTTRTATVTITDDDGVLLSYRSVDGEVTDDPVTEGGTLTAYAQIKNSGNETQTRTARFKIDGEDVESSTVTVPPGETEKLLFTYETESGDSPLVNASLALNKTETATTTAEVRRSSEFVVNIEAVTDPAPVVGGEIGGVTAEVRVENLGGGTGTLSENIALSVNGTDTDSQNVTLQDGETTRIELNGSGTPVSGSNTTVKTTVNDSDATSERVVTLGGPVQNINTGDIFDQLQPAVNNADVSETLSVGRNLTAPSSLNSPVRIATDRLTVTTDGAERGINASSSTTEVLNVTADNVTVDGIDKSLTTIKGNVTITGDNNTLQNVTIVGNLILNGSDTSTSNVDVTGERVENQPNLRVTAQTPSDGNIIINGANNTVDGVSTDGDIVINALGVTVSDSLASNVTIISNGSDATLSGVRASEFDIDPDANNVTKDRVEILNPVENVVLDSVSSLLNENEQPLTDDSITAVEAEPSATNSDEDGDGDAVNYSSDVDIPVVAVDDNVVGVTGPFVTTDTDFANFGNEEVMLNLYDRLLGGSGTVLHDEGHGQFYTLSPNGGDDFQAFADYAENNSYTYTATSDIANDLSSADAVVITSPSQAFSQSELDALSTFVDNGGVVFLHDQSDFRNFDATDNHNEIASALGADFRFNDDQVIDNQNNTGVEFVPTTGKFNTAEFPGLFSDRPGLGLELEVNENYTVDVVSVTDGDTVDVQFNNSEGTVDSVRIVGIDTPETGGTDERLQEYEGIDDGPALKIKADEATTYAQNQLDGKTVTLSFDPNEGLRGDFGRLLGFLELPDGSVYNEEVIRDGWARVYDSGFAQHDEYWDLEQQARANDRGIWNISDPAATPEVGDEPVEELFFPDPVEVTGPETPVSSENGTPLVALDTGANVAAIGGPLIEERFESGEDGPGTDQYDVYPFLTNVIDNLSNTTGPVVVDGGHDQFGADYAVSAEDTAYYMRYLEGQFTANESFIGLEGTVDLASGPGPDLLQGGSPAARAVIISTPTTELSAAERTAVADFANAGGAVILLGSAEDTDALTNFNPLLSDLNTTVGFTTTAVTDANNSLAGDSSVPTTTNFDEANFTDLFTAFTPPAEVTVSNLSPQTATVNESEAFDVSATVENVDNIPADQQIELRLEPSGAAVATKQVQLAPGENTTVTFPGVSVDQAGEYNHTVASLTDQVTGSLTVEAVVDMIVLDSVSSLLNENEQPLTNDSLVAVEAEPTATNVDADGNNDAVDYPDSTDIPVVAVDGNVVGVTGPFVQEDDFIDYTEFGNDEFLLNLYDDLLGGSGTILHDKGHGQSYDVASIQTFADTVGNNGYTYEGTTDLEGNLSRADAVVITSPSDAFTQTEMDALSTFVDNGGAVFLHDQSDFGNSDATDNHNEIAAALNASFRFNDDQVEDSQNNNGVDFSPVTENFNLQEFGSLFDERPGIGEGSPGGNPSLTVAEINADAQGPELEEPQENVIFENTGDSELDLTGYSVSDETTKSYQFPDGFTLQPGEQVTLYSGTGTDTGTELYWGRTGSAVWNNGSDTVFVTDDTGTTVIKESYS